MSSVNPGILLTNRNKTESPPDLREYLMNWLSVSADNIVILILLVALAVKFIFFEDRGEIARQLRYENEQHEHEEEEEANFTDMDKLTRRFAPSMVAAAALPTGMKNRAFPGLVSSIGENWIEVGGEADVELVDKEIQTEERANSGVSRSISEPALPQSDVVRSVEECLTVYRSEVSLIFHLSSFSLSSV